MEQQPQNDNRQMGSIIFDPGGHGHGQSPPKVGMGCPIQSVDWAGLLSLSRFREYWVLPSGRFLSNGCAFVCVRGHGQVWSVQGHVVAQVLGYDHLIT